MRILVPLNGPGYELAQPERDGDFETINALVNGTPRADAWKPIELKLWRKDERGRALKESDAPWLGAHSLILRPRAIQAMKPILEGQAELLPTLCEDAELWIVNPLRLLDALDENASRVKRLAPGGRIWKIDEHVFIPDRLEGSHLFKITSLRVSPTFVDEAFAARWKDAGLKGLEFVSVWPKGEAPR